MKTALGTLVLAGTLAFGSDFSAQQCSGPAPPTQGPALQGAWSGDAAHDGERVPVAFEFESLPDGQLVVRMTLPALHLERVPIAKGTPQVSGAEARIGLLAVRYDRESDTLTGTMPEALVPVYRVPFSLRRVPNVDAVLAAGRKSRPEPTEPLVTPAWTFDAGAPCWPGPAYSNGTVIAGCDDGRLHALDAATGRQKWVFQAGGPIRTRATVEEDAVYFQADDGVLYRLSATDGAERWRLRLVEKAVTRLPLDNPSSRYDCFGSDVAAAGDRLYLGAHDGRVVAVDARRGTKLWEFKTGDSVTGAPAVAGGRVYAGSFDKHVYALDQATGSLVWKRDTQGVVVSAPAVEGNRLIVGNRAYDLLGLDAVTGEVAWRRYIWFSWVESPATVRDGVAYVGSSDAAVVYAVDTGSGRPIWTTDVRGWAWGQPAVAGGRVYVGAASQAGYMGGIHRPGILALDRISGKPVWRFAPTPAPSGTSGFPGSAALGPRHVFFAGVDGKVYAFAK